MPAQTRATLDRNVGGSGFFALAFGSMIGVGWVTAMGTWLQSAGPVGAMLALGTGGLLMLCIGLCYAELCAALPVAGGEVAYAYRSFGVGKSFLVGWFLAFGYLAVSAFEAISVGRVLGYLLPDLARWPLYSVGDETVFGSHLALAALTTSLITWINYRGAGVAAKVQVVLTVLFGLATVGFVTAGIAGGSFSNLAPAFGSDATRGPGLGVLGGFLAVFVTAPFWFVGFDTIPQAAEEADVSVPPRTLAKMIPLSIVGAIGFYVVVILAVGMSGPWQQFLGAELTTAAAFRAAFESPLVADLVLVAALLGLFTSWNGFFLAGSRVLFALGRGRIAAGALGRTHPRHGTPSNAVLFAGAFTFAGACLGRGAMVAFIDVGSFCMALAFFGVTLSLVRLRHLDPDLPRPWRLAGGTLVPRLAALGAAGIVLAMILPVSPAALVWPLEWLVFGAVLVCAFGAWTLGRRERQALAAVERDRLVLGEYAPTSARETADTRRDT